MAHEISNPMSYVTANVRALREARAEIDRQLDAHADAHIFTSLPRSGRVRAARLLTEIGDCRADRAQHPQHRRSRRRPRSRAGHPAIAAAGPAPAA